MSQFYPKEKYSMFVGYWQSWDAKNSLLVEKKLKEGKKVLICVMDNDVNEKTPLTPDEVEVNIKKHLWKYVGDGRVKTIKIPDIESINFGSILDYEVIFHEEIN
jgi:hypothetical protein